jgi:protoporphyrinogen oxidase
LDLHLLEFVRERGLEAKIFWQKTKSGFYGRGKLVSFSSSFDFLKFPFLSIGQKLRLAAGILFSVMTKDPKRLEGVLARDWLIRIFGRNVYANFWEPLLRSKFGAARDRVSATFIWATINRLYGARSSSGKQEKMGQVKGGYRTILGEAERRLSELNIKIMTKTEVRRASLNSKSHGEGQANESTLLLTEAGDFRFNKVLFTVPSPIVFRILGDPDDQDYWRKLKGTEYLRVVCVFLILRRKLSPYYLINLLDRELPFTGIIEGTNVFSPGDFKNRHLIYLPRYMAHDDPLNSFSDGQIAELFVDGLRRVFPDFGKEDVLHSQVFRENHVQPLIGLGSLEQTPTSKTPWQNVFLANTSLICSSTLNNNAAIRIAQEAARTIVAEVSQE